MNIHPHSRWTLAGAGFLLAAWVMTATLARWPGRLTAHEND